MDLNNQYNPSPTEFYSIGYFSSGTIPLFFIPRVSSGTDKLPVPAETSFTFYAVPVDYIVINPTTDILVNEDFSVVVSKTDNFGNHDFEILTLNGPVRVESIPEPMSLLLYVLASSFCLFIEKIISKK
ncbi:MAG: hypothetical protein H7A34_07925 [bacterium]|nr:hypothetical protein [bacterium]